MNKSTSWNRTEKRNHISAGSACNVNSRASGEPPRTVHGMYYVSETHTHTHIYTHACQFFNVSMNRVETNETANGASSLCLALFYVLEAT